MTEFPSSSFPVGTLEHAPTSELTPRYVRWAVVVLGTLMATHSLFRHWFYLSRAFDLGFYVQDVWAISAGIWRNTIFGFHVFDDHFSPVLILLAPLGLIAAPEGLLIVQAAAVASGLIPAYKMGSRYGGGSVARLMVVWYGLSAAIWHAVAYDFHPVTLGVPLLMWLIDAADDGRHRWVPIVLALGLALIREDLALLGGVVLIQAAALRHRWRDATWSLLPIVIGVGYFVWSSGPQSSTGGHQLWTRFSLGGEASFVDLVAGAASNLVRLDPIISFAAVLLPVLVLPAFVGWRRSWPGLAVMVLNGVATYGPQGSLYFQYFAPVVPFILWGAVASRSRWVAGSAPGLAIVAAVGMFVALGPLIYMGYGASDRYATTIALSADRQRFADVLASVPDNVSVSATESLVPHLSQRREIYPFPGPMICPGVLIFYISHTSYTRYVAIEWDDAPEGLDWPTFLSQNGYEEVTSNSEVAVWQLVRTHPPSVGCPSMEEIRRTLNAIKPEGNR